MAQQDPTPQTTLLILLGASSWPSAGLRGSVAFENAVSDLKSYFISDSNGFHLPDILEQINVFLKEHNELSVGVRDILVYFVGHGNITSNSSTFYLAIYRTQKDYEKGTSITIDDLAERLKKGGRFQRRILILDCCFAAAAVKYLQGPTTTEFLREKMISAFEEKDQGRGIPIPNRGTSFLGSSGKDASSIILPDESSTMFTSALLSVLCTGDPFQNGERLSLNTVHRLTIDYLSKKYKDNFPWPELHSPDQTEGKVENIPFFPNPAIQPKYDHPGEPKKEPSPPIPPRKPQPKVMPRWADDRWEPRTVMSPDGESYSVKQIRNGKYLLIERLQDEASKPGLERRH